MSQFHLVSAGVNDTIDHFENDTTKVNAEKTGHCSFLLP